MDKKLVLGWLAIFAVTFVLLMSGISTTIVNTYTETEDVAVREITDWDMSGVIGPDNHGIYELRMSTRIPLIHNEGETLMFYSYHSSVDVYVNGKRIYAMSMKEGSGRFEPVLPDAWNSFEIAKIHQGQEMEVVMKSPYQSSLESTPEFLFGDKFDIIVKELKHSAVSYILSILLLVCGIIMTVYSFGTGKNRENGWSMMYLGLFSVFISLWFFVNIPLTGIFTKNTIPLSYISYLILGTLPVPFILFERSIVHIRCKYIWDILVIAILIENVVIVGLQLADVVNLKESLIYVHYMLVLSILSIIVIGIFGIKQIGLKEMNKINRTNIQCAIFTAVGVGADLLCFYFNSDLGKEYIFTKLAMTMFVITLGGVSMKESVALMEIGKTAQKFEKMAYRDELTGAQSRTAYTEMVRNLDLSKALYTVFMFDLNNLKLCNDTLGHTAGDEYIMKCAGFISKAFKKVGICYRIGGDEFCIIGKNVRKADIDKAYIMLNEWIDKYNQENPQMNMSVAFGYAAYDCGMDEDIRDTRARADRNMYKNKVEMKTEMEKNKKTVDKSENN